MCYIKSSFTSVPSHFLVLCMERQVGNKTRLTVEVVLGVRMAMPVVMHCHPKTKSKVCPKKKCMYIECITSSMQGNNFWSHQEG